jgi:hypothetical protein
VLPDNNHENNPLHHISSLPLVDLSPKSKLQVLQKELKHRLIQHATMLEDWSSDVLWLWSRCQPSSNQSNVLLMQWLELIKKLISNRHNVHPSLDVVDKHLEEEILGVDFDDGEEANNELIGGEEAGDD